METITTYYRRGKAFKIVKNEEGFFLAIDTEYIDAAGKLTKALNGLQMNASKDLKQCIKNTQVQIDTDYYMNECGLDVMAALQKAVTEK